MKGANENACSQMEAVFSHLLKQPSGLAGIGGLGTRSLARVEHDGLPRAVSDYVAGMTDSYLRSRYSELH